MAQQAKFSTSLRPRRLETTSATTTMIGAEYYAIYCTEAITAYADKLDMAPAPNMMPALVRMEVDYLTPLMVGEALTISVRTTRLGRSSYTQELQLTESKSGRPIAIVVQVWVNMDLQTGRSTPLPEDGKQKIIAFEGKENIEIVGR